ncbi:MAG: hypothetical protein ACK5Y2_04190 [Bdellovibrionales bacterium]
MKFVATLSLILSATLAFANVQTRKVFEVRKKSVPTEHYVLLDAKYNRVALLQIEDRFEHTLEILNPTTGTVQSRTRIAAGKWNFLNKLMKALDKEERSEYCTATLVLGQNAQLRDLHTNCSL